VFDSDVRFETMHYTADTKDVDVDTRDADDDNDGDSDNEP
jgi:hypothetical protein